MRMTGFVLDLATLRPAVDRVEAEGTAADVGLSQPEWREAVRGVFQVEKSGDRVSVRVDRVEAPRGRVDLVPAGEIGTGITAGAGGRRERR